MAELKTVRVNSPFHLNMLVNKHCFGLSKHAGRAKMIRHDVRIGVWTCVDLLRQKGINAIIDYDIDKQRN